MAVGSLILEILQRPTIGDMMSELVMYTVPLWIAVAVGVLVGWSWKPKWADSGFKVAKSSSSKASIGVPSLSILSSLKFQFPSFVSSISDDGLSETPNCSSSFSSQIENEKHGIVNGDDLEYLCKLVEVKDGGPDWIHMMDRSTSTMSYRAWRRDLEAGPPQYRSSSVFENATPEMVRDFFWDDEFRLKWDDMMVSASTLEECPITGNMVVHWVRKFPFFCSDREYIIGRRIWESGHLYYCVTKGIPCSTVPKRKKPRRVDFYYSSWCIRAVESKQGNNQVPACEVLLFHYEDMGIPWEVAKIGVRQGMWGTVKKIELGLRTYQKERALGASLSRCAFMAQVNSKVSADYLQSLETSSSDSISNEKTNDSLEKPVKRNVPKMLVIGGAVLLACSLDRGLLTKAVIFGVARRFAKIARRL